MAPQKDLGKESSEKFTLGYEQLLRRAEQALTSAATRSEDALTQALDSGRGKAIALGELTREEADKVHEFVTRDLHDVGQHLLMEEREIADWLHLNLLVVEKSLLNRFTTLAQMAKMELKHLEKARQRFNEWHTGEVTTIGTLVCTSCGEQIHFKQTGHIPPCPKCHASVYERVKA